MHSQHSQQPPLPHHPQAHYYGTSGIDFGLPKARLEDESSDDVTCCLFDSLALAGEEGSRTTENVLLVGHEHALDVYAVDKSHFSRIGRLEGLRGSVIGAKILPSTMRDDPIRPSRPLVAVIVHGPYVPSEPDVHSPTRTNQDEDEIFDPSNSMLQALDSADTAGPSAITHFQNTVEVFSLKKGEHMVTLFRGPKQPLETSRKVYQPTKPLPDETLRIQANGRFISISSGTSGEVFLFESKTIGAEASAGTFQCIGKVWTRVSHRRTRSSSNSSNSSELGILDDQSPTRLKRPNTAIVSLSHRWLAVVPPTPSSQSTLHGIADTIRSSFKPPGLTSHTSPAEPQVNCELDTPDKESLLNKVARYSTQEFIKRAKWVGGQGMQAWNTWYSKTPEQNTQNHPNSFPGSTTSPQMHQAFPPTHAHEDLHARANNEPTLVSIIDLEKLAENQHAKPAVALQPIATFSLPNGCSTVSFAPSGLILLTASAKGDVKHVWDLMRIVHGGASNDSLRLYNVSGREADIGPTVRQITCVTRLTEARIIDVVWTEPRGDRFAYLTEPGTVHIHDLPSSAFQWPPSRRVRRPAIISNNPSVADQDLSRTIRPRSSSNTFSGALDMVAGRTQPLLANLRGRPISKPFSGFSGFGFTAGAGVKGTKVVATGFNKSVGAAADTVNTIRHRGENRLTLPGSSAKSVAGCMRWLSGKHHGHLAVTGGDLVRIYPIQQSSIEKGGQRRPSVVGKRSIEYSIPSTSGNSSKHARKEKVATDHDIKQTSTSPQGFWLSPASGHGPKLSRNTPHPLSCAEIETNAPYQPFHTDRRINFYVYNDETNSDMQHVQGVTPWVFGESIAATKVNVRSAVHDTDSDGDHGAPARMENLISYEGNEEEGQQVVVTTRRKRGKKGEATEGDDGEFFEDDCEVVDFAESRV